MDILTIASPDKISLNMFTNFIINKLNNKDYVLGNLHSLMNEKDIDSYLKGFMERNPKALFCYYAKKKINVSPQKSIPKKLIELSDVVIWFNLYATNFEVVKDNTNNFIALYEEKWKKMIETLNLIDTRGGN